MARVKKKYDNIIKSSGDKREYRGLELNNKLKVVLISDPTADKSAAAMAVQVGEYLIPPTISCMYFIFFYKELFRIIHFIV